MTVRAMRDAWSRFAAGHVRDGIDAMLASYRATGSTDFLVCAARMSGGRLAHALMQEPRLEIVAMDRLSAGDAWAASAVLEEASEEEAAGFVSDFTRAWAATTHRLAAESLPPQARAARARLLRLARREAKRAAQSPTEQARPHGLRECALLAPLGSRARTLFAQAVAACEAQNDRYGMAWTLLERGRAGRALGWPQAHDDVASGRLAFSAMGVDPTPLERNRPPIPISDGRAERDPMQRLEEALHEKQIMLDEVHHRVRSNLQLISSTLSLQADMADEVTRRLLDEVRGRIDAMAMLDDLVRASPAHAGTRADEFAASLVDSLLRSFGPPAGVDVTLDVAPLILSARATVPCGMILNELVTNSLRHAFPHASGRIRVVLQGEGKRVRLVVADDGVGMRADDLAQTCGLTIVRALTAQLGGVLEWRGPGTIAELRFVDH